MAKKKQEEASKHKQRQQLEQDTQAFIESGGEIQQIPTGQSGVDAVKPRSRHIRLANSNPKT